MMLNKSKPGLAPPGPSKKTICLAQFSDSQYYGKSGRLLSILPQDVLIDLDNPDVTVAHGHVPQLFPDTHIFENYRNGAITWQQFRSKYIADLSSVPIHHGKLIAELYDGEEVIVDDGDTLLCTCSKAKADDMRCHRAWAAHLLKRCNWRVMIDSRQLR